MGKEIKIEEIDKNFKMATVGDKSIRYYNALKPPFQLTGFPWFKENKKLYRLPKKLTKVEVNEGALFLSNNTAGGMIRFKSDSPYVAIRAKLAYSGDMNHMPRAGSMGFDIYRGTGKKITYAGTVQPNRDEINIERLVYNQGAEASGMKDWTICLPLYGGAEEIEIGLAPESKLKRPTPHTIKKPVIFYGSSITQGGCASRPGNAYTSMLCRAVDAPQINLGFSGSGRGEIAIAKAIASLKLSAFIMDYDHNAPTAEHLAATHEIFFMTIRERNPDLPVIFVSRCDFLPHIKEQRERRKIIKTTYKNALKSGDKNVYFIDGEKLFGKNNRDACTVDGCHPNDLGFYRMFKNILPALKKALKT